MFSLMCRCYATESPSANVHSESNSADGEARFVKVQKKVDEQGRCFRSDS